MPMRNHEAMEREHVRKLAIRRGFRLVRSDPGYTMFRRHDGKSLGAFEDLAGIVAELRHHSAKAATRH